MSLVADYSSNSSDSDSSTSSLDNEQAVIKTEKITSNGEEKKVPPPLFKLPTPKFSGQSDVGNTRSVFGNPFLEAENAKEAILEKHVKMVDTKDAIIINGKKICWNYRKGRCRFGHNCKYAHDSDLQKTQQQLDAELETARAQSVICQFNGANSSVNLQQQHPLTEELDGAIDEGDSGKKNNKKRKRPGLTQGLVPGKKVMKQYLHNKN